MGSDDVRENAEALLAAWDRAPACGPIPAGIIEAVIALRAALAVAPATATDRLAGMPPHFHFGGEAIAALESAGMGRNGKPNCLIDMILEACNALRAAPPAPGDAAAVRDSRTVNSDGEPMGPRLIRMLREAAEEIDEPIGFDDRCKIAVILKMAADYTEALPLPAAAPAVAEARKAVIEKAKRWERDPARGLARHLTMADLLDAVDAVDAFLAAEAAATHAAKGGV